MICHNGRYIFEIKSKECGVEFGAYFVRLTDKIKYEQNKSKTN